MFIWNERRWGMRFRLYSALSSTFWHAAGSRQRFEITPPLLAISTVKVCAASTTTTSTIFDWWRVSRTRTPSILIDNANQMIALWFFLSSSLFGAARTQLHFEWVAQGEVLLQVSLWATHWKNEHSISPRTCRGSSSFSLIQISARARWQLKRGEKKLCSKETEWWQNQWTWSVASSSKTRS